MSVDETGALGWGHTTTTGIEVDVEEEGGIGMMSSGIGSWNNK